MRKTKLFLLIYPFLFNTILANIPAYAQLSPGRLSKYHDHLEGNQNCTQCHELGRKELSSGCLDCHSPLRTRINAGLGYHKNLSTDCGKCHSEHNSEEFELVYWRNNDINAFDHEKTGYGLTGKHKNLECRKCHTEKHIKSDELIDWAARNTKFPVLKRTFLGLQALCEGCHADVHAGEVTGDCTRCHTTADWKSAGVDFDHNKARFILTGAHVRTECRKCHKVQTNRQPEVMQLTGVAYDACTRCHADVHTGEVSGDCTKCHTTADWKSASVDFDHNKARFILTGAHVRTECRKCHKVQTNRQPEVMQLTGVAYDACTRCHADVHTGEVSGDCTKCHTTADWKSAGVNFDHNKARFILTGAHVKAKCEGCHKLKPFGNNAVLKLAGFPFEGCFRCHEDVHKSAYGPTCDTCHTTGSWKKELISFDHEKTKYPLLGRHDGLRCSQCHTPELEGKMPQYDKCARCHEDKHYGQFVRAADSTDCAHCHTVSGFKPSIYSVEDHQVTRFRLEGAHLAIPCNLCHLPYEPETGVKTTRFKWLDIPGTAPIPCASCHDDVHRGQFLLHFRNRCEVCHNPENFKVAYFVHNRAAFKLDGSHSSISCAKCHTLEKDALGEFIRYRPIPHACADCHKLGGEAN